MHGTLELRTAIAEAEGVQPEHVQVVTGAAEGLLALFALAAEPGANVVLPYPDFPAMTALARGFGLQIRHYPLQAEHGFQLDPEAVAARIDGRTRLVVVISPHNPTGAVIAPDELVWLHDVCVNQGAPFVCDQVYHPIYYGKPQPTAARLPGAIVLGDFSKALCLSRLRVGWIVDRDAVRSERLADARAYFTISNNALGEALAVHAMRHRQPILERAHRIASRNLELLEAFFVRHRDAFGWTRPAGGFTAFPWLTDGADTMELCTALNAAGIGLVPGRCYEAPTHFRIGFGASGERFAEGLAALDAFVASWFGNRNQPLRARE
jgi:aspartate/methionine/tyrosine aminotransferase